MDTWTGKRVVILGAARQGLALSRFLAAHGAHVVLSDQRPLQDLQKARESIANLNVEWVTDGHPIEMLEKADILCLSGGVPVSLPIVQAAVARGIPLSNDTQIFLEAVPCKTVGITGSAGKTTTTTLLGEMAKIAYQNRSGKVYVGGNIGDPLINYLDQMSANDLAILEISSFQLEQMTISPNIAAILNITPNHLDRHGTMESYTAAKKRIIDFQTANDITILGRNDAVAWGLRHHAKGKLFSFGLDYLPEELSGAYFADGLYHLRDGFAYIPLLIQRLVHVRGEHNLLNILAACTLGHAAGLTLDAILEAIDQFKGVPHRLELVRELHGIKWYNDSVATAPERTSAAIRSFDEPLVLLLGGRDKDLPWQDLADLIGERVDHVVLFGEAAEKIETALGALKSGLRPYTLSRHNQLAQAVQAAAAVAEAGDVVLLSPGATSFDEFIDFAERGESFKTWVQALS